MKKLIRLILSFSLILACCLFCSSQDEIVCPKCGTTNSTGATFCSQCGEKLIRPCCTSALHPEVQKIENAIKSKPVNQWSNYDFRYMKTKYPDLTYKKLQGVRLQNMTSEQQNFYLDMARREKYGGGERTEWTAGGSEKNFSGTVQPEGKTENYTSKTTADYPKTRSQQSIVGPSIVGIFIVVVVLFTVL